MRGSAAVTDALLARDVRVVQDLARRGGPTSRALDELRIAVATLDPSAGDGMANTGRQWKWPDRVGAAESTVTRVATLLLEGRAALDQENAIVSRQERSLWLQMDALRRSARLAQRIDEGLSTRIAEIAPTDPDRSRRLSADLLLPVRSRRRDLLTQLAIAAQGYAALRMIEATNHDLGSSIDRAVDMARTAVRAAALAVRSGMTARQLGQTFTADDLRRAMAAAIEALSAAGRSRTDADRTLQAAVATLHARPAGAAGGPGGTSTIAAE